MLVYLLLLLVAVLSHKYYPVYHSSGLSLLSCHQPSVRLGRSSTDRLGDRKSVCLFVSPFIISSSFLA